MFNGALNSIRTGVVAVKPIEVLWGALFYFIAVILLFSGVSKIIDPIPMIETIKTAFKINENLLILAAIGLPIIEIALGLMLVLKIQTKRTLLAATVMFFCFFVFSIYGTVINLSTDCGCFGGAVKSEFSVTMIMRNIGLLIIVIWLAVVNKKFASAGHVK